MQLLRARAHLRLGRAAEALRGLQDRSSFHPSPDAVATALMLTATAHVRLGDHGPAFAALAQARAVPGPVHPTIRSEIALTAGLAHYGVRDLTRAERELEAVAHDSDIVYARALEYRGWIESSREDYDASSRYFSAALAQLDACRHYDRYLEANALMALASIASEQLDLGAWEQLRARVLAFDWSATGLATSRFRIALLASVFEECAGDVRAAFRSAFDADAFAADDAQRAQAALRRAEIARGNGDTGSHVAFVDQADRWFSRMPAEELRGDRLYVPLTLAEEFALYGDPARATTLLEEFRAVERPLGMLSVSSEVRQRGHERMAEAHVAAARGEEAEALRGFLDAFEIFERVGYRRRATIAALRLSALARSERYLRYAAAATEHLAPSFWMRREARAQDRAADPVAAVLSELERETLRLVCEGRTNRQIAAAQGRSYYTVRNSVSDLLGLFGVGDRRQLLLACRRRGIAG